MARTHYVITTGTPGYTPDNVYAVPSRRRAEECAAAEFRYTLRIFDDMRAIPGHSFRRDGIRYATRRDGTGLDTYVQITPCTCTEPSVHSDDAEV